VQTRVRRGARGPSKHTVIFTSHVAVSRFEYVIILRSSFVKIDLKLSTILMVMYVSLSDKRCSARLMVKFIFLIDIFKID
jgi:hypothetical protein